MYTLCDYTYLFSECINPSDCPYGGTYFVCNANKCECPHPKVLNGDNCVGMQVKKNISQKLKVLLLIVSNISYYLSHKSIRLISYFFLECITPTDCPYGGINFFCNDNKCECPNPKVLDGNKCVGMLPFETKKHD